MKPAPSRTLTNGQQAKIVEDPHLPDTFQLVVDGTPQSHINPHDPTDLWFEYVRRMGHVIDEFRTPGAPISALHLGGGAYTIPRYIAATRPGSRQQVIEIDPELMSLVREALPLPASASIRVRQGDARAKLAALPRGMHGVIDLVVVDVFNGSSTPAHLTSTEFYSELLPFLHEHSLVLVNASGDTDRSFIRGQLATLQHVFGSVVAMAEPQVLRGRRHGNVVIVAGARSAPQDWRDMLPRVLAGGPHPATLLRDAELDAFIAGAKPVTDATATSSPPPPSELFERK